jgi:hypothetical protein
MSTLMTLKTEEVLTEQDAITIEPVSHDEEVELFAQWQRDEERDLAVIHRRNIFRERVRASMPKFNDATLEDADTKVALALPLFNKQGRNFGREEVRNNRRITEFWNHLRPAQRVRLCRALALVYLDGYSNATAKELKVSLYNGAVLNRNLWNGLLILLARFEVRVLLMRFRQYSQVQSLDLIKIELETKG